MPEARRSSPLWLHLVACALVVIAGCSDQSQADPDAAREGETKAVSVDAEVPPPEPVAPSPPPVQPKPAKAEPAPGPESAAVSKCPQEPESAYPTDAPYYPAAATVETCRAPDGRIKRMSTVPAQGEQVYEHMSQSLEAQGWSIKSKLAQSGQFALDAEKADRRVAVLIADREIIQPPDGMTRITVLVTP